MEVNNIQQVHPQLNHKGLQNSIQENSTPIQVLRQIQISHQSKISESHRSGNSVPSLQEGHRKGQTEPGIFLHTLHGSEERHLRASSGHQSEEVKQDAEHSHIQNAIFPPNQGASSPWRFHDSCRFKGRFFPFKNQPFAPKVPSVRMEKPNLPVSGPPIRSLHLPSCFFVNNQTYTQQSQNDGFSPGHLPRRHITQCSIQESLEQTNEDHLKSLGISRFHGQHEEVQNKTLTGDHLSRSSLEHTKFLRVNPSGQTRRFTLYGKPFAFSRTSHMQTVNETSRKSDFRCKWPPYNPNEGQTHSKGSIRGLPLPSGSLQASAPQERLNLSPSANCCYPASSNFYALSLPHNHVSHGLIGHDVGRFNPRTACFPRPGQCPLGFGHDRSTHQFQRIESRPTCPIPFRQPSFPQDGGFAGGQQHRPLLPKEQRGHQIQCTMQTCMSNPNLVRSPSYRDNSQLHSNSSQSGSRRFIKELPMGGMVPKSSSCRQDFQSIRSSSDRPVRLSSHDKMQEVLFSKQGQSSPRQGRLCSSMALSHDVCISSPINHTGSDIQILEHPRTPSPKHSQKAVANSPLLDGRSVDFQPLAPPVCYPKATKIPRRTRTGCHNRLVRQEPSEVTPDPVAAQRYVLSQLGYQPEVSKRVGLSIKKTSDKQYRQSWKEWCAYCRLHNLGPFTVSVNKLANYLLHLFDAGLSSSYIGVHRSAVCYWLQPHLKKTIASHKIITRLMDSFFKERPPSKKVVPPWDVQKVLTLLKEWSPPDSISLKQLTYKCAFLLALATAKRVSDIALLSSGNKNMLLARDAIMFIPKFGAKTDRPTNLCHQFFVYRNKEDTNLCPVLYLKYYLKVTEDLRTDPSKDSLFLGLNAFHAPASGKTIRNWLAEVIKLAGANFSPGSTRNFVVSTAYATGVSLKLIIDAGNWCSVDTPAKHYFSSIVSKTCEDQDALQRAVLKIH